MCKLYRTRYHLCTHPLTTSFTPCTEIEAAVDSPELCPNRTTSWIHNIEDMCPTCAREPIVYRAGLSSDEKQLEFQAMQQGLPSPRLVELKRSCSVRGRGSLREKDEKMKRKSQLLTPPLSRSPTFMQTRHPRPPTPPSPPHTRRVIPKGDNGLLTPPLPDTPTFLQPRDPPKKPTERQRNLESRAKEEHEKAKSRAAIQIGCPSLGYTKVVVDDEEEKEDKRELSASEIIERRIAALTKLEGKRDGEERKGKIGRGEVLRAVAYRA